MVREFWHEYDHKGRLVIKVRERTGFWERKMVAYVEEIEGGTFWRNVETGDSVDAGKTIWLMDRAWKIREDSDG